MLDELDRQDADNPPDLIEIARRQRNMLRRVHELERTVKELLKDRARLFDPFEGRAEERPVNWQRPRRAG
jgi:hypothetical protein